MIINYFRILIALSIFFYTQPLIACNLQFAIDGDKSSYTYDKLPAFVIDKIRNSVEHTDDESKRYKIKVSYECTAQEADKSASANFTIQYNTIYIKSLNDVPLCVEKSTPDGLRCEKGKYNYVDYKGGADLSIDEKSIIGALKAVAPVSSASDLEAANSEPSKEKVIHDAIRLFAFILAESARFDYVLDDIGCSVKSGAPVKFMDYWILLHNWGSISSRVDQYKPSLKTRNAHQGAGKLFVPITREMIPFFNKSLNENPPKPGETSPDGKNKEVPIRKPLCDVS